MRVAIPRTMPSYACECAWQAPPPTQRRRWPALALVVVAVARAACAEDADARAAQLDEPRGPRAERAPSASFASCNDVRAAGGGRVLLVMAQDARSAPFYIGALADAGLRIGLLLLADASLLSAARLAVFGPRASNGSEAIVGMAREPRPRPLPPLEYAIVLPSEHARLSALVRFALREFPASLVLPDSPRAMHALHSLARELGATPTRALSPADARTRALVRCSLPPTEHRRTTLSKADALAAARQAGVPVPWREHLSADAAVSASPHARATMDGGVPAALMAAVERRLPLLVKTNQDGSGVGVRLCRSAACVRARAASSDCRSAAACEVQEFVDGATVTRVIVALDGRVISSFAYAMVLTAGPFGFAHAGTTVEHATTLAHARALVQRLAYSGVAHLDFRVDRAGRASLVDANFRLTRFVSLSREALGMRLGPFDALRAALLGGKLPAPLSLGHSLTFARLHRCARRASCAQLRARARDRSAAWGASARRAQGARVCARGRASSRRTLHASAAPRASRAPLPPAVLVPRARPVARTHLFLRAHPFLRALPRRVRAQSRDRRDALRGRARALPVAPRARDGRALSDRRRRWRALRPLRPSPTRRADASGQRAGAARTRRGARRRRRRRPCRPRHLRAARQAARCGAAPAWAVEHRRGAV